MMHILQAQVYDCITAKKWKREGGGASKSQINQARWNRTVLKFGSENQLNTYNTFELILEFSLDRTIWKKSRIYQCSWVCVSHLECRSLVLKMWE